MSQEPIRSPRSHPFAASAAAEPIDQGLRAYMSRVYGLMAGGLAASGLVAWFSVQSGLTLFLLQTPVLFYIAALAPLGFVFYLAWRIHHISPERAQLVFWTYAAAVGISLSAIFLVYTGISITRVFLITAASFAALSLYGYTTKRDLSALGSFLFMALFGLILASIFNWFAASPALHFAISVLGVLIFAGLTAYDTQKIRNAYYQDAFGVGSQDSAGTAFAGAEAARREKTAIIGALSLYLDFLNMFLFLLQLLGERR